MIEQHIAKHYKASSEEKKSEEAQPSFGQELTNSFLPTTAIEGKGEGFAMDGMPTIIK